MNRAILRVSPQWFTEMLKSVHEGGTRRYDIIENALPLDAQVIEAWSGGPPDSMTIDIHVESASFPETKEGDTLPILEPPVFQVYYDEAQV